MLHNFKGYGGDVEGTHASKMNFEPDSSDKFEKSLGLTTQSLRVKIPGWTSS